MLLQIFSVNESNILILHIKRCRLVCDLDKNLTDLPSEKEPSNTKATIIIVSGIEKEKIRDLGKENSVFTGALSRLAITHAHVCLTERITKLHPLERNNYF